MDIVPCHAALDGTDGHRNEAAANQYFLQLLQENRQVNFFIQDPRMQEALELRAERRHAFVLDNVYAEASSYISPSRVDCRRKTSSTILLHHRVD